MAQSYVTFTGNGSSTGPITLGFNYILKSHVKVYESRDILLGTGTLKTETTHYTFNTAGTQISMVTAPANGVVITVERETPNDDQIVAYADGSNLIADSLNNADKQTLFCTQELEDRQALAAAKAEAAKTASDTATANVTALTDSKVSKDGSIAMTGNLQLGTNRITGVGDPTGNQDAATKNYVDLKPGATGEFNNTPISLNDDIKINFGSTDDAYIDWNTDGWFDELDIHSAGNITLNAASGKQYTFFVDRGGNNAVPLQIFETYIGPRVDIKPYPTSAVDLGASDKKWKDLYVDGTGYIDTVSADDITGAAIVTSGTSTSDTKVYSAKRCDELYYNLASAEEIQSGETWVGADNKVATTAAIDARIVDLVDDVGGFVPIANETSFPNANPDINNGAGTLVSVPLANNLTSNGSGVISISNGTVGNSTVTINGAANNTTYTQGFGIIVETTTTLNTYTFHRYVPKATEVTTVAGNIANVNTVAGISSNVTAVSGISSNVTTLAGNTTNINTCATNISAITGASTQATNAASSATAAASSATASSASASTASTQATNSATSATASAASASTASTQATNSATSATASAASEANALAYRNTAETYKIAAQGFRDATSGIYTQAESGPYNLADNVSSHTAWGDITDTGANAVFENETSNILLTMSEGSSSYDYGAVA